MDCKALCVYFKLQPADNSFLCAQKNIFRGRMNDVNNEPTPAKPAQPCRWNPVNWLPFLLYYPLFFLDVQKCNIRSSSAETQHECLPGILSMAKNNLILSGSVKILFAWLWCASLCLSVLWQAGDMCAGCRWNQNNHAETLHWGDELKHATFTFFSETWQICRFVDHSHRERPCCFFDF